MCGGSVHRRHTGATILQPKEPNQAAKPRTPASPVRRSGSCLVHVCIYKPTERAPEDEEGGRQPVSQRSLEPVPSRPSAATPQTPTTPLSPACFLSPAPAYGGGGASSRRRHRGHPRHERSGLPRPQLR
jgi:hypothetical protein